MSYTLRDAQHVCWKTHKKLDKNQTILSVANGLVEETAKVSTTIEKQPDEKTKQTLATQLSDVLYSVFVLAEYYGISLEETFLQSVNDRILSHLP